VARLALEAAGYDVVEAADGREAVELAQKQLPGLLIFDIQMPVLDGYGAIAELRRDERFERIPAIAMTAFAMQGDEQRAMAAGFTRHISKPVNFSNLRQIVAELLV
jgi:two-component system cell cycle response regulator DivK